MYIYLNGEVVPGNEARVSGFDTGISYGYGIFETMRVYTGRPYLVKNHLARLAAGAQVLRFPCLPPAFELAEAVQATISANNLMEGSIRLTVTRGPATGWPVSAANSNPTVLVTARKGTAYRKEDYQVGYAAVISRIRRNEFSPLAGIKSLNYLDNLMAREEARDADCQEAVLLNTSGEVCEGSISNIFVIMSKTLLTPALQSGCLPGVTRANILELAPKIGFEEVKEVVLYPEQLYRAQECFLTGSLAEVMPLTSINGRPVANGTPGQLTLAILQEYRRQVQSWLESLSRPC